MSTATNELTYNTVSLAIEGWEELKKYPDYEKVAGTKVLQRYVDTMNRHNGHIVIPIV
jgi:hypothetical protein